MACNTTVNTHLDVRQLGEKEDALALRLPNGLHDPDAAGLALERFHEQAILRRENKRGGKEGILGRLRGPLRLQCEHNQVFTARAPLPAHPPAPVVSSYA